MSGKPIPEEAVAQVCDRMLTAAIGKDWRKRAPEAVTAFWMGEVREALQEVVPALTAAQQQGQGQGGGEVVAHGFYDPATGAYSETQRTPRWLPAVVCTAPPSAPADTAPPPSAPVGVEWPLSLLRAGHWHEVYIGHRCMRLEVTYDYATWERLMAEVESALAQQTAATAAKDAEIEALRAEVEFLRRGIVPRDDDMIVPVKLLDEINASGAEWKDRAERLAEALRRYGVHDQACVAANIPICTCGLDAALEQEAGRG